MAISNIPGDGRSGIAPAVPKRSPPEVEARATPPPSAPERIKPSAKPVPDIISGNTARLRVDPNTDRIIAEIVNEQNEVVKQIPPEELLELAVKSRAIQGLLFDRST